MGMKIETTMTYHLPHIRMVIIKKSHTSNGEDMNKREPPHALLVRLHWFRHYGKQYGISLKIKNKIKVT